MLNWLFSIRTKLLLAMLLAALFPLIIKGIFTFYAAEKIIFQMQVDQLRVINETKIEKLSKMVDDIDQKIKALQTDPTVLRNLAILSKSSHDRSSLDYQTARNTLNSILQVIQRTSKFDDIFLEDVDSHIIYGSDTGQAWKYLNKPLPYTLDWIPSKTQYGISYTPIFLNTQKGNNYGFLVKAPVYDEEGTIYGNVIFEVSLLPFYGIIGQNNGLGKYGESILFTEKDKGDLLVLSPLRFNKQSMLKSILKLEVNDSKEYIEFTDYHNKRAIGVSQSIPKINFSLLTMVPREDIFASINKLKYASSIVGALATLMIVMLSLGLSFSITRPLQELVKATVGLGNKNFNISLDEHLLKSKDEIGSLARAFQATISVLRDYYQSLLAKNDELKNTQARLVAQEKLASLGVLTAGVAHEIKNPLNFINNFAVLSIDMMPLFNTACSKIKPFLSKQEGGELSENLETLKDNLNMIQEQGLRANGIIELMLLHSRKKSVQVGWYKIDVLLNEAINISYHGYQAQSTFFEINIQREFDASIPEIEVIAADLSLAFVNLFNNAFYAIHQKMLMNPKGYSPTLWVKTQLIGQSIEIDIRDNGIGIPEFLQERLFLPFFTTKPTGEGTGLGLSLARSIIVDSHQGTITCESKESVFTLFVITLPIKGGALINKI